MNAKSSVKLCLISLGSFILVTCMASISSAACALWSGNGYNSLKAALDNNMCVQISSGIHTIEKQIYIPSGRTLTGMGSTVSTLAPSGDLGCLSLLAVASSNVTISNFRLTGLQNGTGNKVAALGIAVVGTSWGTTTGVVIDSMQIDGVRCDGTALGGSRTILRNSVLTNNGGSCNPCDNGYGSAVSANIDPAQYSDAPQIYGNNIHHNAGTGVDIDRANSGYLGNNSIWQNDGIAGFVMYQSHGWTIENNYINNSGGQYYLGHPYCNWRGDNTGKDIGILFCCDQDYYNCAAYNTIRNNPSIQGYLGILLIGADEVQPWEVPRFNTISANNVFGSTIGCADDYIHGQWVDGDNTWTNNNCGGTPNTPPMYFK